MIIYILYIILDRGFMFVVTVEKCTLEKDELLFSVEFNGGFSLC